MVRRISCGSADVDLSKVSVDIVAESDESRLRELM